LLPRLSELVTTGTITLEDVEIVKYSHRQPRSVPPDRMAEHRIKRLPVVDEADHLVGILSRVDVLRTMGEDYHAPDSQEPAADRPARVVGDVMRTDVPRVGPDASLGEVLDAVTSTRLNRAIVVGRDDRVLGVVTDRDLLAQLDPGGATRRSVCSSPDVKSCRSPTRTGDSSAWWIVPISSEPCAARPAANRQPASWAAGRTR
jgi:CBS domain-containing protein